MAAGNESDLNLLIGINREASEANSDFSDRIEPSTSSTHDYEPQDGAVKPISKSQQKKLAKRAYNESMKAERRQKERAKIKFKRQELKKCFDQSECQPKKKYKMMKDSDCTVSVAIDLSLDHLMTEQELLKSVKQIQRCYSLNRTSENPVQLHLTSFDDQNATKKVLGSRQGCLNWDVHYKAECYSDVFDKDKVIYLSSESDNVLNELSADKAYIIGGLVDHNRHKGLSHRLASEAGIQHARLPIQEYFKMETRKVLTTTHVFEILLNVSNGQSWEQSLQKALPARKGAQLKTETSSSN